MVSTLDIPMEMQKKKKNHKALFLHEELQVITGY